MSTICKHDKYNADGEACGHCLSDARMQLEAAEQLIETLRRRETEADQRYRDAMGLQAASEKLIETLRNEVAAHEKALAASEKLIAEMLKQSAERERRFTTERFPWPR